MTHHVLVVEDEIVTRTKLVGYFENEGYKVSQADSGAQMREIMATEKIDLVMLDINLPGEDGLMLTRELRSRSEVGIILVTGRTDSIDRIVGLEMGADDYVTKAFRASRTTCSSEKLVMAHDLSGKSSRRNHGRNAGR